MPDADPVGAGAEILTSAFGTEGESCLAVSVAVVVGGAAEHVLPALTAAAAGMVVGPGDEPGVQIGPLIRAEHRDKVAGYVDKGVAEGAKLLVDGRDQVSRPGFFLGPTILDRVSSDMTIGHEEIFGPVLSVSRASTLDAAIEQANRMALGNMTTIFTQSGRAGREFRERVEAAMTRLGTSWERLKRSATDVRGSSPIRAVPSRCHPQIGARPKSRTLFAPAASSTWRAWAIMSRPSLRLFSFNSWWVRTPGMPKSSRCAQSSSTRLVSSGRSSPHR